VSDLWFGIPAGECFGFLGVNGAGKTTTLRILTGDEIPTRGSAYLGGLSILDQPESVRRMMGYCPQFDALHHSLTGRETLTLYGRIRGIPEEKLPLMVGFLINRLTLEEYADREAGKYSGGNRRKLSVAIALIGNPPIVFLDEPSSGMDPQSRRSMWDLISSTMKGRSIILTTHSMDECEALCGRIGIMVNGRLLCYGSSQHLKSRFGSEYQLEVHVVGDDSRKLAFEQFMLNQFPGSGLIEIHSDYVKYRVPKVTQNGRLSFANMFRIMEANKEQLAIKEYSVSEATLEQIFLGFAKLQRPEPEK